MRRLVRVRSSHVARGTVVIVMRGTATEPTAGPADAPIPADPLVSGAPGGPARGRIAPLVMVVFGASGDLARRKLLPALYDLAYEGLLPTRCAIVGSGGSRLDDEGFRERARGAVEEFSRHRLDEGRWQAFAEGLSYVSAPLDDPEAFGPLRERLATLDRELGAEGRRLFYCGTPPSAFPAIVRRIGEARLADNGRIVLEKPIGHDLVSARELGRVVGEVFDEPQVFRIDHYVGKEAVQNILVFRFANSMVERAWCGEAVDHVEITVAESAGIERRGPLLRAGRRAARHGPEPPAPGARVRGDGAARLAGPGGRPRPQGGAAGGRAPVLRGRARPGPVRRGRGRGTRGAGIPGGGADRARLGRRDVRGRARLDRQRALEGRPLLPAHRESACPTAPPRSRSSCASRRAGCSRTRASRACRHTTWRCASSPTRASRSSSGRRSPVPGWRSRPCRWTSPTGGPSDPVDGGLRAAPA